MTETTTTTVATHLVAAPEISIVIPVYNEEKNLPLLFERLTKVVDQMGRRTEIVMTDDGSKDNSLELLKGFVQQRPDLYRIVEFDRNYGQHMAVMAGFETARGTFIITLDADLQNPPEEIPKLIAEMDKGHDVVGTYRKNRQDRSGRRRPPPFRDVRESDIRQSRRVVGYALD